MRISGRCSALPFALLTLLAASPSAAQETPAAGDKVVGPAPRMLDRIAATVGDQVVTLGEVQRRADQAKNPVAGMVAGEGGETASLAAALDDLIAEKLLLAEAAKLEIEASDVEIDRHVKGIMEQNGWSEPDFDAAVKMLGFRDAKAYREHARKELVKSQVLRARVGSRVRVSDREVEEAFLRQYDGGKTEEEFHLAHIVFRIPESVTLGELQATLAKAEAIRADVAAGRRTFEDAATNESQDGSREKAGDVGWFGRGQLQASLEEAALALKDGEVSGVVQSSAGIHILKVLERRRVPIKDLEEAKSRVRFELSENEFRKHLKTFIEELRTAARVDVRIPSLQKPL